MSGFRAFLMFVRAFCKGFYSVFAGGAETPITRVDLPIQAGQFSDWRMLGRDVIIGVRRCEEYHGRMK